MEQGRNKVRLIGGAHMNTKDMVIKGLTGLARAGETSWFDGHFGAAVLTADRLLKRKDLNSEVKDGIRNQVDYVFRDHADLFVPFLPHQLNT